MIRLDNIGQYMENNRIEAKKAAGGLPHSLWETYSAFANSLGGMILLGIEETPQHALQVNGILDPAEMVEEFWGILRDPAKVSANILTASHVTIRDVGGKKVIVIEVPRASRQYKPIYLGTDPFRGTYRRCGEGDYRCTPDEVRNMLRDRNNGLDARPLSQFSLASIDMETVARYRARFAYNAPAHSWNTLDDECFLEKIGAIKYSDTKPCPTAAGLLMFGHEQDIIKVYPGYYLDYRETPSGDFSGGVHILSGTGDWSGNLCDFYFCVYNRLSSWAISLLHLEHEKDVPIGAAVGEALANGIIHGDYDGGTGLVVEKTWDRLTITNPGILRISPEQAMQGDVADQRNTTLSKFFFYVGVGSGRGSGLRSVRKIWEQSSLGTSTLSEQFNPDAVTLALTIEMDMTCVQDIREGILLFLTEHIRASAETLVKSLHIPRVKLDGVLQELVVSGNVYPVTPDIYELKR